MKNQYTQETAADGSVANADLLALQIRSLIADKEMVTAQANFDLARCGEWRVDYLTWHTQIDEKIETLLSEANVSDHQCSPEASETTKGNSKNGK